MLRFGTRSLALAGGVVLVTGLAMLRVPVQVVTSADGPLWLVPATPSVRTAALPTAVTQLADGKAQAALPIFKTAATKAVTGPYARIYQGRAEIALDQPAAASTSARAALAAATTSYLRERALWLAADAAEAAGRWEESHSALTDLVALPATAIVQARFRLGKAAEALGRSEDARVAHLAVYFQHPATDEGLDAAAALVALQPTFYTEVAARLPQELVRAQALFNARKLAEARLAFDRVRPHVLGEDADRVALRTAQLDYLQKRLPAAREKFDALAARALPPALKEEARHFALLTQRDLGLHDAYVANVRTFAAEASPMWAEAALNELGTHFILTDADDAAAAVFTEQYDRFPGGANAGRAAWKAGWWAFTQANYGETVRLFAHAYANEPLRRSDYRSAWVYWTARAHERLGARDEALAWYDRTMADYGNSYYGREAARARETLLAASRPAGAGPVAAARRVEPLTFEPGAAPPTASVIESLLSAQLWDDAIGEIRRSQRDHGNTPLLEATLAYAYHQRGDLRLAISAMKRAYPRYMADGGDLPRDLATVLFPLDYWELIQKHAKVYDLDPFVVAALMAQESTFDAKIRSAANAWGLMQILPSTGARVARTLGIRPFNTASLTRPETNIRIGTKYFSDLVKRYNGDYASALAAYNAGENRVDRWRQERPGLDRDEFVDGIPFPETQGYVKKILGTADDYRELYRRTDGRR
jgi:soluble lytic murein transglycosylase